MALGTNTSGFGDEKLSQTCDADLRCVICEEDFNDDLVPRNLGCGHSLCTDCLDNYFLKDRDKICPECRQPFYGKSSADLPVNYPLLRLSRSVSSKSEEKQPTKKESPRKLDPRPKVEKGGKIVIEDNGSGPVWKAGSCEFTCTISSPKMQSEFFGMKSYVAYTILPSFSTKHVSRRYKQFQWLHEQLRNAFPLIVLPQLPEKQIVGNLEENLIEYRTCMFQMWLDRICRHPILSHSEIFQLFITVTNEKLWKSESLRVKNETEAHKNFYSKIEMPKYVLDLDQIEAKVGGYSYTIDELEKALKELQSAALNQATNYLVNHKQDNSDIGQSFEKLAHVFGTELTSDAPDLPLTIYLVGEVYSNISKMPVGYLEQEWRSLHSLISEYHWLVEGLNKNLRIIKKEITRARQPECNDLQDVKATSYVFQAEVAHFNQSLAKDIRKALKCILNKQYSFYLMILKQLRGGLDSITKQGIEQPSAPPLDPFS